MIKLNVVLSITAIQCSGALLNCTGPIRARFESAFGIHRLYKIAQQRKHGAKVSFYSRTPRRLKSKSANWVRLNGGKVNFVTEEVANIADSILDHGWSL